MKPSKQAKPVDQTVKQATPWFSIVVSVYNRPGEITRCIDSCLAQSFSDFELVIVDDGSSDNTVATIQAYTDARIRLICHAENQGMSFARHTGTHHARGQWIVRIDSDHALLPDALDTLFKACGQAPADVGVIGARYLWDTGTVTPPAMPAGTIDYIGRIQWSETKNDQDYVHCLRRAVFETVAWPQRKGSTNALVELNVALEWKTILLKDCLAMEYTDAANSYHRSDRTKKLATRLRNAADQAITYAEILRRHGTALRKYSPTRYADYHLMAALYHFLAGQRIVGVRYVLGYLRLKPSSRYGWGLLLSGLAGPTVLHQAYMRSK